jgi:chromosome partitioning protein
VKVISLSSFKGGTGKSSLSVLLTNTYAAAGKRVLVVDLDHQQNTTSYHATDRDAIVSANIAEAYHRGRLDGNVLPSHVVNVDFVAGSFGILQQRSASPRTLAGLLEPVRGRYDVVVVDCPPTLDNLVLSAWDAADTIVTPARLDAFDLEGLDTFGETLKREAPDGKRWIVAVNFYRSRSTGEGSLGFDLLEAYRDRFPLSDYHVPDTTAIFRAVHNGEALTDAKRTQTVFQAIVGLAGEAYGEPVTPAGGSI